MRVRFRLLGIATLAGLVALAACDSSGPHYYRDPDLSAAHSPGAAADKDADPGVKLIREAALSLEASDVSAAVAAAKRIATDARGFVTSEQTYDDREGGVRTSLVLRIPATGTDGALDSLRKLGKVVSESVTARDVTKEWVDLEARLRVKRDTETRLRSLLSTRTAALADVVAVEKELDRVLTEIEQMEAQRRLLDRQVELATVTVEISSPEAASRSGILGRVGEAFRDARKTLGASLALLVYLVVFLAPWLVLATAAYLLFRAVRGRRARS